MKKLKRKLFFKFYYWASCVYIPFLYLYEWKFGELKHLSKDDYKVWKKSMLKMLKNYSTANYNFRMHQILNAFATTKFEIIRQTEATEDDFPIVLLCVKNDKERLQMLIEHYRNCGVSRFAFLDNYSTDGTYEWLKEQEDIDLYRTATPYQTAVKEGWINRLVSYYGLNKWYIITDSDELMVWIDMENHPVRELIKYGREHGIKRFKGLTLDTYPNKELFSKSSDIRHDYRFVDSDSYYIRDNRAGTDTIKQYYGGPRYRLMDITVPLSKYPLCYFEKGTISSSAHFLYPHIIDEPDECYLGILHFKFIDKDLKECQRRSEKNSGFSSNGLHYKKLMDYVGENENVTFMYDASVELADSHALKKIKYIEEIPFNAN